MVLKLRPKRHAKFSWVLAAGILFVLAGYIFVRFTPIAPKEISQSVPVTTKKDPVLKAAPETAPPSLSDSSHLFSIPKLGIHDAHIVQLGLTKDGAMDAPGNNSDVGWYTSSAVPGSGQGAVLIDGHAGIVGQPGVFSKLGTLTQGDSITIQTQANNVSYQVRKVETLASTQVDMRSMMKSIEATKEGLNLITCTGDYALGTNSYNDRILVYAVRVL
jgi:LPXTG-site transpeptidase (sortase) family protein